MTGKVGKGLGVEGRMRFGIVLLVDAMSHLWSGPLGSLLVKCETCWK
jgi:hypothetical protein